MCLTHPTMRQKISLGVDLGGTQVRVGQVSDDKILNMLSSPIPAKGNQDQVLQVLFDLIDQIWSKDIDYIGMGVPSVVDYQTGTVYDVINIPSWKEVKLKAIFEKKYGVPVWVENDANCFALAENLCGKGKNCSKMVGMIMGTGLAAGVIIDHKIYPGAQGGAGEIGMIPYLQGKLEDYCSGQFFTTNYQESGQILAQNASKGNSAAISAMSQFGIHVGEALKIVLYTYDPEMVVLGGSVKNSFEWFEKSMWEVLNTFEFSPSIKNFKLDLSEMEYPGVIGAASLARV